MDPGVGLYAVGKQSPVLQTQPDNTTLVTEVIHKKIILMIFKNKAFARNSVNEIIVKRYAVISAKAVGTGSHTYLPVTTRRQ
jgi:hypothetical protein